MIWTAINTHGAWCRGEKIETQCEGKELLTELYRHFVGNYPKFFKMDGLSRTGFVASEILIQSAGEERFCPRDDRAVVLFNRASSLEADRRFQATISSPDDYYPSPSVFVYTLPNIVTGEIAIRNKYFGETSFCVLDEFDAHSLARNIACAFCDETTLSVLTGWVDCTDEAHFECIMMLVDKQEAENQTMLANKISEIYNVIST